MGYESTLILGFMVDGSDVKIYPKTIRFFVAINLDRYPTFIIIEMFFNSILHTIAAT
jgi:hypothetical protein